MSTVKIQRDFSRKDKNVYRISKNKEIVYLEYCVVEDDGGNLEAVVKSLTEDPTGLISLHKEEIIQRITRHNNSSNKFFPNVKGHSLFIGRLRTFFTRSAVLGTTFVN